jgi:hypothetical protein
MDILLFFLHLAQVAIGCLQSFYRRSVGLTFKSNGLAWAVFHRTTPEACFSAVFRIAHFIHSAATTLALLLLEQEVLFGFQSAMLCFCRL